MKVELKHYTPLWVASDGIRTCWASQKLSDTITFRGDTKVGEKDKELINRIGNKFKHKSTLEHLTYNFQIKGVSRALLQELARHRIASPSVKSTRYTLKELKEVSPFNDFHNELDYKRASEYLVWTNNPSVDESIFNQLEEVRLLVTEGISNDYIKYALPEAFKTELAWTVNARSLQNFLSLRSNKAALWEIQDLSRLIFDTLPEEHKYLFEDFVEFPKKEQNA